MKKILKLFACIGLVFSVAACSTSKVEDEALDRIETGLMKLGEIQSFDYTIGVDVPNMKTKGEVYGTFLSEGPELSLGIDLEAEGEKVEKFMEIYLKDNMMYMSMLGINQKQEADMSAFGSFSFDPETLNFDKESLKKGLEEATVDGDTLHLVVKKELVKESVEKQKTDLTTLQIDEVTGMTLDVELKDDFVASATITVEGTSNGEPTNVSLYMKLNDINKAAAISYPEGMEDWPSNEESSSFDF